MKVLTVLLLDGVLLCTGAASCYHPTSQKKARNSMPFQDMAADVGKTDLAIPLLGGVPEGRGGHTSHKSLEFCSSFAISRKFWLYGWKNYFLVKTERAAPLLPIFYQNFVDFSAPGAIRIDGAFGFDNNDFESFVAV